MKFPTDKNWAKRARSGRIMAKRYEAENDGVNDAPSNDGPPEAAASTDYDGDMRDAHTDATQPNVDQLSPTELVALIEEQYDADIYVYSAPIDHEGYGAIVGSFSKRRPNAILILTTNGGLANSAYKIARFFQSQYDQFSVCIPSVCKSAGTLLALGANRLFMGPFSELGPLDVQLYERDEIFSRKSGLLSHSAFEALHEETFGAYEHTLLSIKRKSGDNISFSVASAVAAEIAHGVMAPIYAQISPNILGSDHRDLQVAVHYGTRLANRSGNISPEAVDFLTKNYPSHDFIIDKDEAEVLFERIDEPSRALWKLIGHFGPIVTSEVAEGFVARISDVTRNEGATGEDEEQDDEDAEGSETDHAGDTLDGGPTSDLGGSDRAKPEGADTTEGGEAAKSSRRSRDAEATA